MPDEVTDPAIRDRYIVSSLIEEAIASSQLEGAATTRRVARDMIKSGRKPRDRAEQMILNNYTAMSLIRSELRGSQITPDEVYELHRVVTEGTLDDPLWAGRPQTTSDERVRVFYGGSDTVVHVPPPASELPKRIERMCDFASDPGNGFVHPVLKAIILHFWLAYDHPFEDGNGRTARALFYWSLMRDDYWLFEFISISRIIKSAQAKYERAFLHSESDGNDLTYFLLHQLSVIDQAISELYSYLDAKVAEAQELERMLRTTGLLNHRQLALVAHALRHPEAVYTYISHAKSHSVVRQTARNDLLELEQMELLTSSVVKRVRRFTPTDQLEKRIRQLD